VAELLAGCAAERKPPRDVVGVVLTLPDASAMATATTGTDVALDAPIHEIITHSATEASAGGETEN
jgi:hypothetical protein